MYNYFIERYSSMNPIIDPNIAYVLLVVGFFLSVLALLTPGTGVVEIIGIFSMNSCRLRDHLEPKSLLGTYHLDPLPSFDLCLPKDQKRLFSNYFNSLTQYWLFYDI